MKHKLSVLFVLALLTIACSAVAATPQYIEKVVTAKPAPATNPPNSVAPPTVSDPPMVSFTGPTDCLPYPSFKFLYIDGIETGVSLQVLAKAEAKWSEPGVDWWEVKFNDGGADFDCWVYGGGSHVTTTGDFSQVKVHVVLIPPPPKNHCDTDVKLAKARIGVKVRLPYKQAPWMGRTGWFDGMSEYSGKIGVIMAIAGLDLSWCQTVYVAVYGYDTDYPWRVRDLDFSVKKGD